jgi:hypothetical protein
MAKPFKIELLVSEPPSEAEARAAKSLSEPANAVGLRLTGRGPGELQYRPKTQFPFTVMLWHKLNGEKMTARFEPGDGGGTRVTISGAVAAAKHSLAADSEHWAEALGSAVR